MGKSLAELRQSEHVGLVEQTYPICVAGRLQAEYAEVFAEFQIAQEDDKSKSGRIGAKSRSRELADRAEKLREEMNEHLVAVRFRAKEAHEWREWVAKHPPRDGQKLDRQADLDFDALIGSLGDYVVAINDEKPGPGDWEFVAKSASYGDLKNAATMVYNMHQSAVDIPKSLLGWLSDQQSSDDSD